METSSGMKLKIWAVDSQRFETRDLAFPIFVPYLVLSMLAAAERDCSSFLGSAPAPALHELGPHLFSSSCHFSVEEFSENSQARSTAAEVLVWQSCVDLNFMNLPN